MCQKRLTLIESLKVLIGRLSSERVHFSKTYLGKILLMEDGKKFQVIRDLKVDPKETPEESVAVFTVRFKFSGLPLCVNKRLSMFPAPFLIALPGFRRKIWTITEDGYFQGIYQWARKEFAEMYQGSFIFKLMTKRSAENTLSCEVIPNMLLIEYVENLIQY
jgi:hypothetical protein